ncbi:hypothetical protein [Mycobacterium sp. ACS4331]|uniref:hypothetical protein n=1 Tax=Mycobacterium sp. ACS4331 TaxID=1834121 RepID=UPI0008006B97|nr:hypothetical protein [Mycobacterium sp. ACS4331]OBF30476.1 hypothetical protein A5727_00260 [Mycobacterium sp. ACS4331]
MRRRFITAVLTVLFALVTGFAALVNPPLAHADGEVCAAQLAAAEATGAKIDAHNARRPPGGVAPPHIADPYNREAEQLNAERDANAAKLRACAAAATKLTDSGPLPPPLTSKARNDLTQAKTQVPPGWSPPAPVPTLPNNRVTVPSDSPIRPVWDVVKKLSTPMKNFPNTSLQGQPRPQVGDRHPSQPWTTVGSRRDGSPAVSADHIVPKVEIMYLPRFMELSPDDMWLVLNAPLNLQWLPSVVNVVNKNSRSAADMQGVDATWRDAQTTLQNRKRAELTELIATLADSRV